MLQIEPHSCQETKNLPILLRQPDHALDLLVVHTDDLAEVLDDCGNGTQRRGYPVRVMCDKRIVDTLFTFTIDAEAACMDIAPSDTETLICRCVSKLYP